MESRDTKVVTHRAMLLPSECHGKKRAEANPCLIAAIVDFSILLSVLMDDIGVNRLKLTYGLSSVKRVFNFILFNYTTSNHFEKWPCNTISHLC